MSFDSGTGGHATGGIGGIGGGSSSSGNGGVGGNSVNGSIANITARVIGADIDGDENFDLTDIGTAGFELSSGDTAIDGLVIVLASGYDEDTVSVTPHKLITIQI